MALDNLIPTLENEIDFRKRIQIGPRARPDQSKLSVSKVLITPAIFGRVLTKATSEFFNLIISYYPLIENSQSISGRVWTYLRLLAKNYINVYVLSPSWLIAENGANESIGKALNLSKMPQSPKILQDYGISLFTGKGYVSDLIHRIKDKFDVPLVRAVGDIDNEVQTIAIKAGTWNLPKDLEILREFSVDTVITGEFSYSMGIELYNRELNGIELGVQPSLKFGINRLVQMLSLEFEDVEFEAFIINDPREIIN